METSFLFLRRKAVINIKDGRNLGRVRDVFFTYPEGNVMGFSVGGEWVFRFTRRCVYIDLGRIIRIGEDAILVDMPSPVPRRGRRSPFAEPMYPPCERKFDEGE